MPIYEYKCSDCGNEFEELVFNQDDAVTCPECKSEKTEKLMSACSAKTGGNTPDFGAMPSPGPMGGGCGGGG